MTCDGHVSRRTLLLRAQGSLLLTLPALLAPGSAHAEVGTQQDWAYCQYCHCLFWGGDRNNMGRCTTGYHGQHAAWGYNFLLHYDSARPNGAIQYDWRYCVKCRAMFWNGDPNRKGRCAAGGAHAAQGFNFGLYTVAPNNGYYAPGQPDVVAGWRFCNKCWEVFQPADQGATYPDPKKVGWCAAGGTHNAQGFNFFMQFNVTMGPWVPAQ